MVRAKNCETASTFVKVIQRKLLASFFPDTVYKLTTELHMNDYMYYIFIRNALTNNKVLEIFDIYESHNFHI